MRNWLKDQYVVLTGASGGIGRELCKLLICKYKAKVIGVGRREEKMLSLTAELGESSPAFSYRLFDVGSKADWQAFKADLEEKNIRPALLINNAGAFPAFAKATDVPSETVEKIMRTNFLSCVYGVEALSPLLIGQGKFKPAIVNICSSGALCTIVGTSSYAASKSAMKGYSEALQLDEIDSKYVGIIYPGTTATELFRDDKNTQNSILDKFAMPASKMAKKVAKAILRRKKRAVLGWDAKLMNFTAKVSPVKGVRIIRNVMKVSKSKVFSEVFGYDNEK